ncbi:MAG: Phage integrase family protein [Parcubacteria group bacterium Gr01-1014_49]|nr:MAG: Phage integrase family protein [Parcubacteria group bacterium Gr01-1014_49]
MQITPRVYQKTAVKAALKGLRGRLKRALVVLATGLGKTLTTALVAKQFQAKQVLFLVHNNFILDHAIKEFRLVFDEKTLMATYNGMSKDGAAKAGIVFSTWQTMGKSLKEWRRNHFDLIIVDEAHHSEADTYKPVLEYFAGPRLGITATPDREDKADIRKIFGTEVINVTLEEAIARGWLPRIEYHVITDESLDEHALQKIAAEIREAKKRFTMAEVNRRIFIKKRDAEIARIINGYNEKAVVFCASITHADRMSKSLNLAQTFHSQKGDGQKDTWGKNQATLDALKNGVIRRVCAVNAFNEGVNVPSVGLVAFCRVTGVLTVFRQQLGRGLRPGKDKLIVLDFVGNLERIQLVLEMMNKISDLHEKCTTRKERGREGYVRERFEVSGKGFEFTFSDQVVDLMQVLGHCEREFYATWQEASEAAVGLGLTKYREYADGYRQDPLLPSMPRVTYPDYPGDTVFFGREKRSLYGSCQEASRAAIALGIRSAMDYRKKRKADPRLPAVPEYYKGFPGWTEFLGKTKYETLKLAKEAARKLGIRTVDQYRRRHREDPRLPTWDMAPHQPGWKGWEDLLGPRWYPTLIQASRAAKQLGIDGSVEYNARYKEDPLLPSAPANTYKQKWRAGGWNWHKFLGKK